MTDILYDYIDYKTCLDGMLTSSSSFHIDYISFLRKKAITGYKMSPNSSITEVFTNLESIYNNQKGD